MPRRLGASVPATVSRLLQGGFLQTPPAWYGAVGSVAPLRPSLTRKIPKQAQEDSRGPSRASTSKQKQEDDLYAWKGPRKLSAAKSRKSMKYSPPKPAPIQGLELHDRVRRMFFADHPFEAFRGIDLVEQEGVNDGSRGPHGEQWTELRQRSWNPSPDDCVAFVLNLHQVHGIPLALAYQTGISQFQSLRASYEVSLHSAQVELESHGFEWPTEFSSLDRLSRAEDQNILNVLKDKNRPGVNAATSASASGSGPSASSLLNPTPARTESQWTSGKSYFGGRLPLSASSSPEGNEKGPKHMRGSQKQGKGSSVKRQEEQASEASSAPAASAEQTQAQAGVQ